MGKGDIGTAEAIVHQLFLPIVTPEDTESDNTVTPEYASGNGVTGFCLEQGCIYLFFSIQTISIHSDTLCTTNVKSLL